MKTKNSKSRPLTDGEINQIVHLLLPEEIADLTKRVEPYLKENPIDPQFPNTQEGRILRAFFYKPNMGGEAWAK